MSPPAWVLVEGYVNPVFVVGRQMGFELNHHTAMPLSNI